MKKIVLSFLGVAVFAGSACLYAAGDQMESRTKTRGTVLSVPSDQNAGTPKALPHRSMTKSAVRRAFGDPEKIQGPVGDPPITRWDYPGFHVFFEYDLVLHTVVPGEFPPIDHRDQLISDR